MNTVEMAAFQEFAKTVGRKINLREEKYGNFSDWPTENIKNHTKEEIAELLTSDFSGDEAIDVAACCFMIWFKENQK